MCEITAARVQCALRSVKTNGINMTGSGWAKDRWSVRFVQGKHCVFMFAPSFGVSNRRRGENRVSE